MSEEDGPCFVGHARHHAREEHVDELDGRVLRDVEQEHALLQELRDVDRGPHLGAKVLERQPLQSARNQMEVVRVCVRVRVRVVHGLLVVRLERRHGDLVATGQVVQLDHAQKLLATVLAQVSGRHRGRLVRLALVAGPRRVERPGAVEALARQVERQRRRPLARAPPAVAGERRQLARLVDRPGRALQLAPFRRRERRAVVQLGHAHLVRGPVPLQRPVLPRGLAPLALHHRRVVAAAALLQVARRRGARQDGRRRLHLPRAVQRRVGHGERAAPLEHGLRREHGLGGHHAGGRVDLDHALAVAQHEAPARRHEAVGHHERHGGRFGAGRGGATAGRRSALLPALGRPLGRRHGRGEVEQVPAAVGRRVLHDGGEPRRRGDGRRLLRAHQVIGHARLHDYRFRARDGPSERDRAASGVGRLTRGHEDVSRDRSRHKNTHDKSSTETAGRTPQRALPLPLSGLFSQPDGTVAEQSARLLAITAHAPFVVSSAHRASREFRRARRGPANFPPGRRGNDDG